MAGFDLWLNLAGYSTDEVPKLLPLNALHYVMNYVEVELCKETKSVVVYNPMSIRFTMNGLMLDPNMDIKELGPINYETEIVELKFKDLSNYSLREIRYSWQFLKILNSNLSEALPLVNMSINDNNFQLQNPKNSVSLTIANYIANFRVLIMGPIKLDLVQRVMGKTAIPRE